MEKMGCIKIDGEREREKKEERERGREKEGHGQGQNLQAPVKTNRLKWPVPLCLIP